MATLADTQYYVVLFLLWVFSTLLLRSFFKKPSSSAASAKGRRLPPSPPSLPIIGHAHLLSKDYYRSLQQIGYKYGPVVSLRLGLLKCVHISDAKLTAEIFKTQDITVCGKARDIFGFFGISGIVTAPYGEYWRFMKKLCMTEVLSMPQIQRTRGIRHEELTRFLRGILEKSNKKEAVNMGAELQKLTNANISRMSLSTKPSDGGNGDAETVRQIVVDLHQLAGKVKLASMLGPFRRVAYWLYGKRAIEITARFDELLDRLMKEHEEKAKLEGGKKRENKDLMDILLEVHDDPKADLKITKDQIKAFLRDIFMGGTTTIADTTQWALAEIFNRPEVFKKIREEVESVVGKNRLVEESDIPNLHYLQSVVKETLRMYAAVPVINRAATEDTKIAGYDIPKGTILLFNAYTVLRDPAIWENPDEFRPERFANTANDIYKQNFNYIPFGIGRRSCPGSNLALASTHVIVAAVVQCFDWKIGDGDDDAKINTKVGLSITTSMAEALVCTPKIYNTPFAAASK